MQSVPDEATHIEFVAQHAVAPLGAAADGGVIPNATARTRNAFIIQGPCDGAGRQPSGVVGKDPADDGRLGFVNFTQAALRLAVLVQLANFPIPIGYGAQASTSQNPAGQAAMRLGREVFQIQRSHRAFQADVELRYLAFGQREDPRAGEARLFIEGGDVFLVAGEAVEALRQDDVALGAAQMGEQRLVARAKQRRA